jgi:hypothetical protein
MNRRSFVFFLPAAAGFMIGCKPKSDSGVIDQAAVQDALRGLEGSIGGLEMELNNVRDSSCGDMVTAVGGAAASVRSSFDDLKRTLGSPDL